MANITTLRRAGSTHQTAFDATKVTVVENVIDFAEALAARPGGGALAATDTIEALTLPPGTIVQQAGIQIIVPANSTTLTLDLGLTGGDVDEWVDGLDAKGTAGSYSPYLATDPLWYVVGATGDTIDLLFATLTGTLTAGKVRVYAVIADISGDALRDPGLAQLGS